MLEAISNAVLVQEFTEISNKQVVAKKAIETAGEWKRQARDLGNMISECDNFKRESARRKEELKRLNNLCVSESDNSELEKVEMLREIMSKVTP